MTRKPKPYATRTVLLLALVLAIGFSALSLFFLGMQARNAQPRLAGKVVAVAEGRLTIRNAKGRETVLVFEPDMPVRGVSSAAAIVEGQHVMTRGSFTDDGVFEVERLRLLKEFELR